MANTLLDSVDTARTAFAQARRDLVDRLWTLGNAQTSLRDAQRRLTGSDLKVLEDELADAETQLQTARAAELNAFNDLQAALANWLPDSTDEQGDFDRLNWNNPIVLFPVRLETRFDGATLKVRIFPDEVFLDTHETALTEEEHDAAKYYYEQLNRFGNEGELWRDLVARFGVPRSAYILRQMLPIFGDVPSSSSGSSSLPSSCGGTLTGGGREKLTFPDDIDPGAIQFRSGSWTRPGEAVLPDRWVVVTYSASGGRRYTRGARIPEPLAMTADPNVQLDDMVVIPGTALKIDKRILWTVDYQAALDVGMAIDVSLVGDEPTEGLDRVVVVGVKSSMTHLASSRHLEKLLDAHHYTRGMAMVRQGSPTKSMEGRPTSYPPQENAGKTSFVIERQPAPFDREYAHQCLPNDTDGYALATALGVPSGVMTNIERARCYEIENARQMNTLIWSGTLGHFMRHMMKPVFTKQDVEDTRYYFQNYVIGRGPAPAFRIGGTPYGVLPIVSLADWKRTGFAGESPYETNNIHPLEAAMISPLRQLLEIWKTGVDKVPVIRPGVDDFDTNSAETLSTTPSSRQFNLRVGVGIGVVAAHDFLTYIDTKARRAEMNQKARELYARIGEEDWTPRIGRVKFERTANGYFGNIVVSKVDEELPLEPNFFSKFLSNAPTDINLNDPGVNNKPQVRSLLYDVVRHSLLQEYLQGYIDHHNISWAETEVFNVPSKPASPPALQDILDQIPSASETYAGPSLEALRKLAGESTAELERLFTESLDITSHRLDAWLTAVAYRRLSLMRTGQIVREQQLGDFIGGCGWLEDVRPIVANEVPVGGVMAETSPTNGGFVHTPSLTHAAAAAVLRNAHMSVRGSGPGTHAVYLSSRRVRSARRIFEGVRNGQPIGALLGYDFERALHDKYSTVAGIDEVRYELRNCFPLVANQGGSDPDVPAEAIAARNVIDGCAILRAYQKGKIQSGTYPGLPVLSTPQREAILAELDLLLQLLDATGDLLKAEAAFQFVSGNTAAAVPTVNNFVAGKQPPASMFTRSARGGIGISHRVALVFPSNQAPSLPITPGSEPYYDWPLPSPRAMGEPVLNAWLGQLIGLPDGVMCTLTYWDKDGTTQIPNTQPGGVVTWEFTVTLKDLRIHPLDLFALSDPVARANQGSILDRRVVAAALSDPNKTPDKTPATIRVNYDVSSLGGRSFPEVLEILDTAGAVIRASRPLAIGDLLPPAEIEVGTGELAAEPVGGTNAKTFYLRARTIRLLFADVRTALANAVGSGSGYIAALLSAADYLPSSAFPDPTLAESALGDTAAGALAELNRRFDALASDYGDNDEVLSSIESKSLIARGTATLKVLFGDSFVTLPLVDPPRMEELALSLGARDTLLGTGNDNAPDEYLVSVARVRERLARWRKLNLYARTSGLPRPRVDVVQLPYVPGELWLGSRFAVPPAEGRSAMLLLNYANTLAPTVPWTGLVLDDWSEIIPNREEQTGIALHYEGPQTQAPQAILVAVPSSFDSHWTFDELVNSLEQTMKLAKIRAVDLEHLDLVQALPAALFAANPALSVNVVTTPLSGLVPLTNTRGLTDD